jgi:transposase-like protein
MLFVPAPHPPEFRRRAVALARLGEKLVSAIAKELSISESCLRGRERDPQTRRSLLRPGERPPKVVLPLVQELADDGFNVAVTCRVLNVRRQAYYEWRSGVKSARTQENELLLKHIVTIHEESRASRSRSLWAVSASRSTVGDQRSSSRSDSSRGTPRAANAGTAGKSVDDPYAR